MFAKLALGWRALVWRKTQDESAVEKNVKPQPEESIFKTLWRCWDL